MLIMMKSKFFIVIALFYVITCISQNEVLELPLDYKAKFYDGKESLAISNPNTGDLVLFIEDTENTKVILLDNDFV